MQNNVWSDICCYGDMLSHVWATTTTAKIKIKLLYVQSIWEIVEIINSLIGIFLSTLQEMFCWKLWKFENFISSLFFYPIYIKFSLFYSKFINLSIELTWTWTGFPFQIWNGPLALFTCPLNPPYLHPVKQHLREWWGISTGPLLVSAPQTHSSRLALWPNWTVQWLSILTVFQASCLVVVSI